MKQKQYTRGWVILLCILAVSVNALAQNTMASTKANKDSVLRHSQLHNFTHRLMLSKDSKSLKEAKTHWFRGSKNKAKKNSWYQNSKKKNDLFSTFGVGYGGPSAYEFSNQDETNEIWMSVIDLALDPDMATNPYYQHIKNFQPEQFKELQKYLSQSKYLIYWLPKGWNENWFSIEQIQLAMDEGMTPVFLYWYFGDSLVEGMPTKEEQLTYYKDSKRVGEFIKKLDGEKLVIMEPEFNKPAVMKDKETQSVFASMMGRAINNIRQYNKKRTYFSLCMTDTGNRNVESQYESCAYENCALGDKNAWEETEYIYKKLSKDLDFISFQEMLAQFSRDPSNPGTMSHPNPKAYTKTQLGIDLLSLRVNNMTKYLHKKYNKPVFMPYIALATASWEDRNKDRHIDADELDLNGWKRQAEQVYQDIYAMKSQLQKNGLFGYAPMAIFDNPSHDKAGYQYFLNNEYHLGIVKTGAKEGIHTKLFGDLYYKGDILDFIYDGQ